MTETTLRLRATIPWRRVGVFALAMTTGVVLTYFASQLGPYATDWNNAYYPALKDLAAFRPPYGGNFYNPPWTLLPLIPLAFLPSNLGYGLFFTASLFAFAYVGFRSNAKPLALLAFLFSYPVSFGLVYGQIDWLPILGIFMQPQLGLFFVAMKPQIAVAIVPFWLVEAWRKKRVVRTFWPVTLAFLLSFVVFGFWPRYALGVNVGVNSSLWPFSIPVGLALLFLAIRSRNIRFAMIAAPFLSPYLAPHGWTVALAGMLPTQWGIVLASIATWVVRILTNQFLQF